MPVILYDSQGSGHNLSIGAFDSVSIAKEEHASLILLERMAQPFPSSFEKLMKDYNFNLESAAPTVANKIWNTYLKPGLKKAGAHLWDLGKGVATNALLTIAGANPSVAMLVAAAEAVVSEYLGGFLDEKEDATKREALRLNRGQWVFIENEKSLKRRLIAKPHEKRFSQAIPKVVSLGFFVSPAYKDPNLVNVFNMETGKTEEVDVRRLRNVGSIGKRLDEDETLSVVRELYFYKINGDEFQKTHPNDVFYPGRNVLYKGVKHMVISRIRSSALIENYQGQVLIVDVKDLKRCEGKSTRGEVDDFFDTNGQSLYSGAWVYLPARSFVNADYGSDLELAVIFEIGQDEKCKTFCALDGMKYHVKDSDIYVLERNVQTLYSAHNEFKQFRQAAVEGDASKCKRFELGSKFATICLAGDEEAMRLFGEEEPDVQKPIKKPKPDKKVKVGNNDKALQDGKSELGLKYKIGIKKPGTVSREEEDSGDGAGMILVAAALVAIYLLAA